MIKKINEDGEGASGLSTLADVPGMGDVKTPGPLDPLPAPPPGMEPAGSGDAYPALFTPSVFKLPMRKEAKHERRIMNFDDFLKVINYKTHDGHGQYGHGQNIVNTNNS